MMALSRRPYDNGMPNAVAGNLHCLAVQLCTLGRKEVNREALVQKNRTLLAKSIQSSRSRSVVNLVLGNEEVSTARKDELLTHPCVGRVEVSLGMFPAFPLDTSLGVAASRRQKDGHYAQTATAFIKQTVASL